MKLVNTRSTSSFLSLLLTCFLSVFVLFNSAAQNGPAKRKTGAAAKKQSSETVVYVVRHAEKAASGGTMMTDDPVLSEAGQKRAEVLRTQLASAPVAALFATKYKRTQQTLQPLAQAKGIPVQTYEATDFKGLTESIRQNHAGKTVVVAGHSNTILSVVEALGGKKPFAEVADHQYDYLFKVTLAEGKEPKVEVQKYGEPSLAPAN